MKGFIKILKNSNFLKKIHIFAFLFCILSGFRELYLTHSLQKKLYEDQCIFRTIFAMGYKVLRRKIIMSSTNLTGKPSVDRPWLQYYPEPLRKITVPECTVKEYLKMNCPGEDVAAMDFYGSQILWGTVFQKTEAVARSMRAVGFKEGDQIPVFLSSVPEFIYILLAAEQIGASLLCRDNTLKENVEAVRKSGAKVIIAQDYLAQHELGRFLSDTDVEKVVLIDACQSCRREDMPDYVRKNLDSRYPDEKAHGPKTMDWEEFLAIGESYKGPVDAPVDVNRPLFRAYTSGSTGPSKQVIHSAHTMLAVIAQMNFYAGASDYRPTWMVTALPPALVAVVVAMELMPLASNKLLILNPYVAVEDVDLELMRCRPNSWPLIPMFIETVMRNGRIPDDYDLSHLTAAGAGSESYNNNQLKRAQKFSLVLERFISPEGTFPVFGRSIPYRMATMQPLALMAWYKELPAGVTPAQVRCALTAVMKRMFVSGNNFNEGGFLTIGFTGHQPNIADWYTNNGSLYMTSLAFLPLGLPASDAFWTDAPQDWTSKKAWSGQPFPKDHHWSDDIVTRDLY